MRLAGVVLQLDWQAALEGSQMMQKPTEFARVAEESVARNMDRVQLEASSRGWLSKDLPSGTPSNSSPWDLHAAHMHRFKLFQLLCARCHRRARWQLGNSDAD